MPLTFRSRKTIIPGLLYLNLGRRGLSLSFRAGPVSHTVSTTGRRTTSMNLPGPFGWRSTSTTAGRRRKEQDAEDRHARKRAALQRRIDERRANIRSMREGRDR